MSTSVTVKPVIIGALFGVKSLTLNVKKNGVEVIQGKKQSLISYMDIGENVHLKEGMFFSSVVFGDGQNRLVAKWLTTVDAQNLFLLTANAYYRVIAEEIVQLRDKINCHLSSYYPRKSYWQEVKNISQSWLKKFKTVPPENIVSRDQREAFRFIEYLALSDSTFLKSIKDKFINSQLEKYKSFFDNVESNPLTDRQRVGCITDEDNNLVIAGAGTGKTSVMIGRAGYLLKANLAEPEEILMLAFARKAAEEMSDRLFVKLGNNNIKASTFHSLGQYIVGQAEQGKPSLSKLAEDDRAFRQFVDNSFSELMLNESYKNTAVSYFIEYLNEEIDPFNYETAGDYLQALIDNDIRTLKGEKVKSYQESVIANYLFKQGVEYEYEAKYVVNTRTMEFRQYQPDFYLPDSGVYIEHYGIDENNRTAPYVDNARYLESMEWKRNLHQVNDTLCIETFHHEYRKGELLENLKNKLINAGVELNPLPDEAIMATIDELGQLTEFTQLLADMLRRFKSANLSESALESKADNTSNPKRFRAATKLLMPIVHKYEKHLSDNGDIDFDDMINKAIVYIKNGSYVPTWKYVMVDEFQDISGPRAELVTEIRNKTQGCSLFCVGDDWQAIYRFTGSDLEYITHFKDKFGNTDITNLDMTFRFNDSINKIASHFITENPHQLKKDIATRARVKKPAVSLMRADNASEEEKLFNIETVLSHIDHISENEATVLLLGRYNFNLPETKAMNRLKLQFEKLNISAMTIHASKGKEADYVVLLDLEAGKHGFPSEKVTHPLLEALLPPQQMYNFAEERRIFYVALTRAKHRVYLIADMSKPSMFLGELLKKKYPIEMEEFQVTENQMLYQLVNCIECETGSMVPRSGKYGSFFGCSHYPRCKHIENGCNCCGSLMRREGRYKVCTNNECDGWVPTCPLCNAEMILRKGKYGAFWGCKNYRTQGVSCGHTEKTITPPTEDARGLRLN